ncbi:unnamed protein product [Polarella glacialis]|uniref:HECT-type E3 ubiquitin transferase n=1 Tax=Polarella glacialis TaxID=89957 RepID=A0A813DAC8_POLGL|nr:unnamed protein product [Polarella glacialis]
MSSRAAAKESAPDFRGSADMRRRPLRELGLEGHQLYHLTFSCEPIVGEVVDFCPGGREKIVTDVDKEAWLKAALRYELVGGIEEAASSFRLGVGELAGAAHLALLSAPELIEAWSGRGDISDEDMRVWKMCTEVSAARSQQAGWLFDMLQSGDLRPERRRLLKFSTGSDRWPVDTRGFKFSIEPMDGGDSALPCAMTCGNMLQLPRFSTPEHLRDRLLKALELGKDLHLT